ncbi:MAG: hypothetical protein AAGF26_07960 [Cyanobacteria bacterium P01_G01_bin.49]
MFCKNDSNDKFTIESVDLFCGIGGFCIALEWICDRYTIHQVAQP